jgi:hypothetical protein
MAGGCSFAETAGILCLQSATEMLKVLLEDAQKNTYIGECKVILPFLLTADSEKRENLNATRCWPSTFNT